MLAYELQQEIKDVQRVLKQDQDQAIRKKQQQDYDEELANWMGDPRNFGPDWDDDR